MSITIANGYEILDRITDGFFALDDQWNFTYVNSEASRLLFRSRNDLVGKNVWEEFPEAVDLTFYDHYHRAIREQTSVAFDAFFPPLKRWFDAKAYPSSTGLSVYFQDITNKKIALSQKEQHYKSLFEQNPDAVFSFDLDGNYLTVNPAMERLLGYSEAEFLQKSFVPLVAEDDLEKTLGHYRKAATGITQRYQAKVVHKNGSIVYLDVTNMPIIVHDEVVGVYGVAKDITDRSSEQDELQKTKERLESFVRDNADAIWVIDLEDQVLEINPTFETMFGWSADSVIGKKLPIIPDFLKESMQDMHERVKTGASVVGLETIRERKDGSLIHVSATLSPILDLTGKVIGLTGICRDVSSRKKAEETLKAKTKQLESFIENNVDSILMFNLDREVVHVNQAFENTFGWAKEEILGLHLYDLPFIPSEVLEEAKQSEGKIKPDELILGEESVRYRKDGEKLEVAFSKFPIYDAKGNMDGWSVILRDITEWKKSQLVLQNSEKLTVAGQLAAGIAHEIRNPITVIKGFIYLMKSGYGDKEEYFTIMASECERIEQILSELLVLAKPQPIKLEPKDIRFIMMQTVTLLHTQAIMSNVEIATQFEQGVARVYCDENQMKQVFINFIKNAIEAMQTGGTLTIQIKQKDDDHVIVRFIDEGTGIPAEMLKKMGQPFYTTKENGTGLGYMVSKQIVENHSGEVHIESEWNKGTTIEISLPITRNS
ncbi:PAS domain-containing sensor histidine kinase [Brevibacillus choshinensis]|uniref:histidine kinase n=1 Tax=Brevibacillus choshinensis TaxID=54911 RepID=A0ABX7FSY1_BRECH|nr:PAS domain-containing sensor histidine kinase [Brevibacillus choshinensis]QRG68855.1 PAS domain S-box protein [Brevibacillus choshinensis]